MLEQSQSNKDTNTAANEKMVAETITCYSVGPTALQILNRAEASWIFIASTIAMVGVDFSMPSVKVKSRVYSDEYSSVINI